MWELGGQEPERRFLVSNGTPLHGPRNSSEPWCCPPTAEDQGPPANGEPGTDPPLPWVPASSAHGAEFKAATGAWMPSAIGGSSRPSKPPCFLLKDPCLSCLQAEATFHSCPPRAVLWKPDLLREAVSFIRPPLPQGTENE